MTNTPAQLPDPVTGRLRVGDCVIDVDRREVDRGDGQPPLRITVKALQVLLALAAHPDKVVSRDSLLEVVWAGTMPTDDVVTQAVTALRRALGDDRDAPAYIETIPKSGYRLLSRIEWLPESQPGNLEPACGDAPASASPGSLVSSRAGAAGMMLAACALVVAGWWWVGRDEAVVPAAVPDSPSANPNGEIPYVLLTSRPGPETQPALSPDGAFLAYAMPPGAPEEASAIFLQTVQPTPPRQLTEPSPGNSDHLPRWSPDGRQLMFARIDDKGGCALHLMPASGGASRVIGGCDGVNGRYDWLPDGSGVIAGRDPPGGGKSEPLSILRLDTGTWQPMDYPIGAGDADFDPHFSPDGTRLAFRRNLSHSDLWIMPSAGGVPRRLTHLQGNITGWDWAPDGRSLLLGLLGNPTRLYRHDLASGRTEALGPLPAVALDIAQSGNVMVFGVDDSRVAMYRYPLPMQGGASAEPLFPSTGNDLLPSPSPDGRLLAFHSDRSRDARLWLGEPDDPGHLRMVEGITPISRHPPQWSADGRSLLVIGEVADADGTPRPQLHEVDAASGRARVLKLDDAPYFAQYLPGRRMLVVVDDGDGRLSLRILDVQSSPMRVLARMDDVGEARFDPVGGQVFLVRSNGPGLWRTGLDLHAPVLVDPEQPTAYWLRRWAVLEGKPFALRNAAPACLAEWRWLGGANPSAAGCLDQGRRGVPSAALVLSADAKWVYASMVEGQEGSDIGLLELDSLPGMGRVTR